MKPHQWARDHEEMQPAFYISAIKRYADVMVERTEARLADGNPTAPLAMKAEMMDLTLEILMEAMFGPIDLETRDLHSIAAKLREPQKPRNQPITLLAPDWAPIPFLRRAQNALSSLNEQIHEIIQFRRENQAETDGEDLLSMLMTTEMSDERIRDQMITFLFAGHETTALTLTYIWDLLSRTPEAERRLHQELDAVFGGDQPTAEDLPDLAYTEQVVREALRLYPPAHEIRREPKTAVEIGGYTIPKGALIVLPTWVMHRDERFWNEPTLFRPERWDEDEQNRQSFAYFPFGAGPRRCIGKQFALVEAQLTVATIAQEYTFERQYDDLSVSAAVTLQPKGDVEMTPQPC